MQLRPYLAPLCLAAVLAACGDDPAPGDTVDTGAVADAADAGADSADVPDGGVTPDVGADADTADAQPPPAWCESATAHRYDPVAGTELDMFPDPLLTRADESSPTGRRIDLQGAVWLESIPDLLLPAFETMETLSGFGTSAGVILRFDAALADLPQDAETSLASESIRFYDLSTSPPTRVPYEAVPLDEGTTLLLWPMRPLSRGARHAVVVTRDAATASGECVSPAPALRDLLVGAVESEPATWAHEGYAELLAQADLRPDDVGAATVFTTHDDLTLTLDLADSLHAEVPAWTSEPTCEADGASIRCVRTYGSRDHRTPEGYVDLTTPGTAWDVPVTTWYPAEGDGPWPTLVFGHGINSSRGEAGSLARRVAPLGFAVVATDAMQHGDHPSTANNDGSLAALQFLGIDIEALALDVLGLRGNFDQTAVDRALLVDLLVEDGDLDGDGVRDVDATRLGYVGISLGGMLGPSLLALAPDLDAAVLFVAGGRLMTFVTDTAQVAAFEPLIISLVGSRELFDRLVPVVQSVVDPADPATWAATLRERDAPPHVLLPVSVWDDTVPPATGRALARALALPHAGTIIHPVDLLEVAPSLPFAANEDGGRTTAYFQYDRVTTGDGVVASSHNNTPFSPEAWAQAERFLTSWAAGEQPQVIDPYAEQGTPPLPEDP